MVQFITLPPFSSYDDTVKLMEDTVSKVINKLSDEVIYLAEYNDIYTAGSGFKEEELINPGNIPIVYTNRGGKFTYHGQGQRIIYPILDLSHPRRQKDLKLYIRLLEKWIISSLSYWGVKAFTIENKVGIWVEENDKLAKIASIGVRVKKWVTYHGIAVNISTNLERFQGIVACGIKNLSLTSLKKLNINITLPQFDRVLQDNFYKILR